MADPLFSAASRRCFLFRSAGLAAGAGILSVLPLAASHATPQAMQQAIRKIVGEGALRHGKVTLDCRRWQTNSLPFESTDLLALTVYVAHLSKGRPTAPSADPQTSRLVEIGREIFERRQGQLNLSCAQCHDDTGARPQSRRIPGPISRS